MFNYRYREIKAWDAELYFEQGIRSCVILLKDSETLSDQVVVRYANDVKRTVSGEYLFIDIQDALDYVNSKKKEEVDKLQYQLIEINNELNKIIEKYNNVTITS